MAQLFDLDVFGRQEKNGSPKVAFGDEALGNALKLWISSRKGDYLNRPDIGGPLDSYLFKLLDDTDLDLMSFELKNAINDQFGNVMKLLELIVFPNFEDRIWQIEIQYQSLNSGQIKSEEILIQVEDRVDKQIQTLIEVDYVGDNLENFVLLKQPDQPNERLIFNAEDNVWEWGQFRLLTFTTQSSNFNTIFTFINGD